MSMTKDFLFKTIEDDYRNCGCAQELGSGIITPCARHEREYREADAEVEYYALRDEELAAAGGETNQF